MMEVMIKIPESMTQYAVARDESAELLRNAMILYPYIQDETLSYGKAAEILGIAKLDLIALYSRLGISYFDQTKEELESDILAIKRLREKITA